MLEKRTPLPIEQAVKKVMAHLLEGKTEEVSIFECEGRYLAEDIIATHDVPLFTRSAFDGYAMRSVDTVHATSQEPVKLKVLEEIGAGMVASHDIGPFETIRIMTGAKVPNGCDTILMIEAVKEEEINGERYITIKREVKKGDHISYQGEEVKKGDVVLKKGTKINPGIMAVLATFGYGKVRVAAKPRVGIFVTGSELLEVDEPLEDGKIRNSNAYMLFGQIKRAGGEPVYLGKVPDVLEACIEKVSAALKDFDLLITTGGVSVGDYDLMPDVYKALNGEVLFNKIAMRPGSVTTVTVLDGKYLFGLSGNPSACYVGFELFVRPVIRNMLFCENLHLKAETARLNLDYKKPNPMTRFVRTKLTSENGELVVESAGMDKSNVVTSLAQTDCLTVLPGGERGFEKGDRVKVLLLHDDEGSHWPW